jgi:integrase/recombinase XerD
VISRSPGHGSQGIPSPTTGHSAWPALAGFARYLQTIDPATEVAPPGVFPARRHRPTPFLWSQDDICRLLESTPALRPALRAATYEALFGLLATCGMRVGEAVGLDRDDVDLRAGIITIRHAKFDRPRLVPCTPRSQKPSRATPPSATARGPARGRSSSPPWAPGSIAVAWARPLRKITTSLGIRTESVHPRAHDLRHSFAVDTLMRWQRSGLSIDEHIATLSTYLGHVSPADTYWYLSASPELMELAAGRLHTRLGARP